MKYRIIILLYSTFFQYDHIFSTDILQLQELTSNLQSLSNLIQKKRAQTEKFGFSKTVLSIGNVVQGFDKGSSCNIKSWSDKPENLCKCCLIKNACELDKGKKPSEVIQICLDKGECTNTIIQELLNQENIKNNEKELKLKELIYKIYNKSVIVKEIATQDIKFNVNGTFTEDAIKEFLVQAYQEGKLKDPNFNDIACLDAKNLMIQKGEGTNQLFEISSDCSGKKIDYILKDLVMGTSEIVELQKTSLIPSLANFIYPKNISGFPSFILPFAYLSYNYKGRDHYLSLMLKAPGILLSILIKGYKNNTINKVAIEQAYYQTGFALSSFHQNFMNEFKSLAKADQLLNLTYIQGDAHQSNIFYDKRTNRVIFIDNEKFSSPKNPFEDIEIFIFRSLIFIPPIFFRDQNFINDWILLSISSFLRGYIDAYKANGRAKLLEELIVKFNTESSYIHSFITYYDEYNHYKYIFDEIFQDLRKIYGN